MRYFPAEIVFPCELRNENDTVGFPSMYNMSWNNEVEKMNSNIFEDHMQTRMPSLSICTYSEFTYFSEFFGVSYIMVMLGVRHNHPQWLAKTSIMIKDQTLLDLLGNQRWN